MDDLCLVCDDVSSGYHYGIPSCNGCKTFFRRSVVRKQTYTCEFEKNCPVDKNFRCACRFCRFEKCVKVGMDVTALQSSRDPIGYTKRPKRYGAKSFDSYWRSVQNREKLANALRLCDFMPERSLREALCSKSLLNDPVFMKAHTSKPNPRNEYTELRFITMDDYHHWHERDWFVLTEYAKTFKVFEELSYHDKVELVRHSAVTVPGLTQAFNSPDHGPDTIVFPDGAFYDRRDEPGRPAGLSRKKIQLLDMVLKPFREIGINFSEYAAFKAITFLNPDANVSSSAKLAINEERVAITKHLSAYMMKRDGVRRAVNRFSRLILISTTMSKMACESRDAVWIAEFFENIFQKYTSFAKELFFGDDSERSRRC